METDRIIEQLEKSIEGNLMRIPEELIEEIDEAKAFLIRDRFRGNVFLELPERERKFFEWLRREKPEVWKDLWGDVADSEELYRVSIEFLITLMSENGRGFPICDLMENDNYYFAPIHINGRENELLAGTVKTRFMNKQKLTAAQLLLMEISLEAIDIWHFAYKYGLSIAAARKAADELVEDGIIVHFRKADQLANFIEI